MSNKPILCVDFDGVIHSYTSGWKGADRVDDPPVPGAFDFLREASKHFDVCIYSSRSSQAGGIEAMSKWLVHWTMQEDREHHWVGDIRFPKDKPPAFLTIDDRAVCFDGTFPDPAALVAFKPWNKRGEKNDPPKST